MQNKIKKEIIIDLSKIVIANKSKINEKGKGEIGHIGIKKQDKEIDM